MPFSYLRSSRSLTLQQRAISEAREVARVYGMLTAAATEAEVSKQLKKLQKASEAAIGVGVSVERLTAEVEEAVAEGERAVFSASVVQSVKGKQSLRGHDLRQIDLSYKSLTGADLRGADLRDANLTGADLTDADLSNANLNDALLTSTFLERANLRGAKLTKARLYRADLRGASLTRADLSRANLQLARLGGADLRGANLSSATIGRDDFTRTKLKGVIYDSTTKWPKGFTPPPSAS